MRRLAYLAIALAVGCGRGGTNGDALPELDIPVENDGGQTIRRLTTADLQATPPSRAVDGVRVWVLDDLLRDAVASRDTVIAVKDDSGRTVLHRRPVGGQTGPQAVLAVNTAGLVLIAIADPAQPLPPFDAPPVPPESRATRLLSPVAIRLIPWAPTSNPVAVTIDGKTSTWDDAKLRAAGTIRMGGGGPRGGERGKQLIDLRALFRHHLGEGTRLVALEADGGPLTIDAARWDDASMIPILKVSRRKQLNFAWVTAVERTTMGALPAAKGVRTLVVER